MSAPSLPRCLRVQASVLVLAPSHGGRVVLGSFGVLEEVGKAPWIRLLRAALGARPCQAAGLPASK